MGDPVAVTTDDPAADDLALLTGDDAADLLQAALGTTGGTLQAWSARTIDVRPASGTTVSYRAEATVAGELRTV